MGDSRKYPYPTTGGMSILTPPCPQKFQNAYPPSALRIPKSLTPPLLRNFPLLYRPFGIPVRLPKSSNERETCTFSLCKRILFTMIKTLAHKQFWIKQRIKRHAVGFYYLHVGVKIGVKYKICQAFYLETRDWCEFSARNNTSSIDNRRETPTWLYFY